MACLFRELSSSFFSHIYFALSPSQGSLGLSGPSGDPGSKGETVTFS